jgi:tetratricopeptide (TPR) repeat protein
MGSRNLVYGVVFIFILGLLFQEIASVWDDSPTFDELVNPSVGYAELFTGDFALVDDHPPLYRIVMAFPLLVFRPALPLDHDSWRKRQRGVADRYEFARRFFYVSNGDADRMLFWSRMVVVFLSVLLGLLVFMWAKELYGDRAGLFALFLYSFEPNIIAHSRLATNDLVFTLLTFATIYQFWRYCNAPSVRHLVFTGLLLALALLSKFSALMLFPMLFALALLAPGSNALLKAPFVSFSKGGGIPRALCAALLTLLSVSVVAVSLVFLFYRGQWGLFMQGINNALGHYQEGRSAFLLGNYSTTGWWYYFPIAFLLKTPVPLLIYALVAFLFWSLGKGKAGYFLLVPVGVVFLAVSQSHLNIGVRHILVIYPFLIVVASSITTIRFSAPRFFWTCFGSLACWYAFSTAFIFPSYLAYFNEFVGPRKGYLALADSNLDWGQDLKRLKMFMDKKGIEEVYLSYFGTADPCHYGIRFQYLPGSFYRCGEEPSNGSAGFIAVSATNLQSVYLADRKSFDWLKVYQPIGQIGYSIFVYDIRGDAFAHNNLGILYLKYKMLDEALGEFKRVVALAPKEAIAHANLGLTYALLSHFRKAREAYTKALQLDPGNDFARERLKALKGST